MGCVTETGLNKTIVAITYPLRLAMQHTITFDLAPRKAELLVCIISFIRVLLIALYDLVRKSFDSNPFCPDGLIIIPTETLCFLVLVCFFLEEYQFLWPEDLDRVVAKCSLLQIFKDLAEY